MAFHIFTIMPRKARLSIPGAVTHVMARCLDGRMLFRDDEDREAFLRLLELGVRETGSRCYAWALMSNHYHLVIRNGGQDLWRIMKPLNMRFAQLCNKKYERRGPLFMDRFKSIVTQDQNYIQELVRYVHLNPVRAGTCKTLRELDRYPWTGHPGLMGRNCRSFQNTGDVLLCFSRDVDDARKEYRKFLQQGLDASSPTELIDQVRSSNKGMEKGRHASRWIIGDPDFIKDVMKKAEARRMRMLRFKNDGENLERIAEKVCKAYGISAASLKIRHRGGPVSNARRAFCYYAIRYAGAMTAEAANFLQVSPGAASNMIREGKKEAKRIGLLSI